MKEEDILEIAEKHLGSRFNRGKIIALANEIHGQGFRDGAARTRAVYETPKPKPRVVRKKTAPPHNTALTKALNTLLHLPGAKKR